MFGEKQSGAKRVLLTDKISDQSQRRLFKEKHFAPKISLEKYNVYNDVLCITNASNRLESINTLAMPVVTYSFSMVNWKMSEIKIRKNTFHAWKASPWEEVVRKRSSRIIFQKINWSRWSKLR